MHKEENYFQSNKNVPAMSQEENRFILISYSYDQLVSPINHQKT